MESAAGVKPVIFAFSLDGEGGARDVSEGEIEKAIRSSRTVWIHLNRESDECAAFLERNVPDLDSSLAGALLSEDVRGRVTERDEGLLVVLRGANFQESSNPEDLIAIRCFLSESVVVTVRKRKFFAIDDIGYQLELGTGPKDSADFLVQLSTSSLHRLEPVLEKLEDTIDETEDFVLERYRESSREKVLEIRKQLLHFHRYLVPQRDVFAMLNRSRVPWIHEEPRERLQELYESFVRIVADLDSWKDRARLLQDEITNSLTEKLNEKLYLLAVLTAVFLPLSFMTGLFGVNVGGIPGAGEPWAFWAFAWLLLVLVALELVIFKTRRWF